MCGIYSSIGFPPDQTRIDIVSYRGPDGRGWREFSSPAGTVALGHRRLAIIDLSNNGLQPMADSSGRFHLIFNGELYNYLELRQQLAQRGEIFRTETDSEVLLRAYQVWGEQALARFRGMFAFVIWDDMEKRLFAARDRFGIKPLYLVANNAGVALASEIKQLLGLPGLTGRMNLPRARDFLAGGIADHTAETLFENVMQLRGGECLSVHAGTSGRLCVRRRRWYSPTDPRQRLIAVRNSRSRAVPRSSERRRAHSSSLRRAGRELPVRRARFVFAGLPDGANDGIAKQRSSCRNGLGVLSGRDRR